MSDNDASRRISVTGQQDGPKGPEVRFNEFLNLPPDVVSKVSEWVMPQIDAGRKRARKPEAAATIHRVIGCILANAMIAAAGAGSIYYSRGGRAYLGSAPYKPDWLHSKQFISTINGMLASGLLEGRAGRPAAPKRPAIRSTLWPTVKLLRKLRTLGITPAQVVGYDDGPVVFLSDRRCNPLPYDPQLVATESEDLRRYIQFLDGVEVALRPAARARYPGDTSAKRVRRIYNRGAWALGGRYYGGWWQQAPASVREEILIDGEGTVELGYANFVPQALYHLERQACPTDPYEGPRLRTLFAREGILWADARPLAKELFLTLIVAKELTGLHNSAAATALPPGISFGAAACALQAKNPQIAHWFFSGKGLQFMTKESEAARAILKLAVQQNIPILPVHDAFRVRTSDKSWLNKALIEAYEEHFLNFPLSM